MTAADPTEVATRQIKRALRLLASDSSEQINYLQELGVSPDEIALEFDDAFRRAKGASEMGLLPKEVMAAAQPVGEHLKQMTDSSVEIWTKDGLGSSPEWQLLRSLAKEAIVKVSKITE
ncbi:hypothetical protein [Streptomyces triculaminicus]|uniref:hypothetical protein n=1 Tax=Streptomyces triculaminicus TaxID=2816232 RepID=UPI0037B8CC14